MEETKEMRELRYDFSDSEKLELSNELAKITNDKKALEDSKKSYNSRVGAEINALSERINSIALKISNGYDYRSVECIVEFHKPKPNYKQVTRTDTGVVMEEKMVGDDYTLFNQLDEKRAREEEQRKAAEKEAKKKGKNKTEEDNQ